MYCITLIVLCRVLSATPWQAETFDLAAVLAQRQAHIAAEVAAMAKDPERRPEIERRGDLLVIDGKRAPDLLNLDQMLCMLLARLHDLDGVALRASLVAHGFVSRDFEALKQVDTDWMEAYQQPTVDRHKAEAEALILARKPPSDAELRAFIERQQTERAATRRAMILALTQDLQPASQKALVDTALADLAPKAHQTCPLNPWRKELFDYYHKRLRAERLRR